MKANHVKAIVGVLVAGGVIGLLAYIQSRNKKEAQALLDYVNGSLSEVNTSKAADQGIKQVTDINLKEGSTKTDFNKLVLLDDKKKLVFSKKTPVLFNSLAYKYAGQLNKAMSGLNVDRTGEINKIMATLVKIPTKNSLSRINDIYKEKYGQGLFEAMQGENALNSAAYTPYVDKSKSTLGIPGLTDASWHPMISAYLAKIPVY